MRLILASFSKKIERRVGLFSCRAIEEISLPDPVFHFQVLDEADTVLTANLSKTQHEGSRLKALNSATRRTTLYSWLAIVLVSLIFTGTYFLIRIT